MAGARSRRDWYKGVPPPRRAAPLDFLALQQTLRHFAAEREWQPFHTPKNLAMALMVEAAELAEIFQWMTPEQSLAAHADRVVQERIGDEVADVLLYLLQLADHAGIDLKRAVGRKLQKNAKKHPPTRPGLPAGTAAAAGPETHVLVDWENVQPREDDLRALVPDVTDVWIFHGPAQKRIAEHYASFGERATLVPIARTGKNALDFHLSFYMGYIASRRPDARFVVLSNDKGYGPMLDHAADLGFAARALGFSPSVAKKTTRTRPAGRRTATPKAAPEAAAKRGRAKAAAVPAAAPAPAPAPSPAPAPAKSRRKRSAETPAPPPEGAAPLPPTAAKKTRGRRRGEVAALAADLEATVSATAPAPAKDAPATKPAATRRPRRRGEAAAGRGAAPAPAPAAPAPDAAFEKAVRHVQAGLRKTADKPARTKALLATIRSLLGSGADDDRVDAVLARLVAAGEVAVDSRGGVRFPASVPAGKRHL